MIVLNKNSIRSFLSRITFFITKLIPKKSNRWVFGAWYGNSISDNSKALFDELTKNNTDIETIWVVNAPHEYSIPGTKIVKRNTLKALFYIATAKVAVFNQGYTDFASLNFLGGVFTVQLWHGVAWKKIGHDAEKEHSQSENKSFVVHHKEVESYSMYIAPSDEYKSKLCSAFFADPRNVLSVGQPRNAIFFSKEKVEEYKRFVQESFGIYDKKIIVYMPTFRDNRSKDFSFFDDSIFADITKLGKDCNFVVIEKSHFVDNKRGKELTNRNDTIMAINNIDSQVLLCAADILITDYSSCFFDFLLRDKPIIHYIYDYDYYRDDDRGLYYNFDEVAAGICAFTRNDLLDAIKTYIYDPSKDASLRKKIRDKFVNYESINNSKIIISEIINRSSR